MLQLWDESGLGPERKCEVLRELIVLSLLHFVSPAWDFPFAS
jgi:hypothetical protein